MHQPVDISPEVDIWVSDHGLTWCLKGATPKGEAWLTENLGVLSVAVAAADRKCFQVEMLQSVLRAMADAGLYAKEVAC